MSAMSMLPPPSTATLTGPFKRALVAGPPLPLKPLTPFPATVVITPGAYTSVGHGVRVALTVLVADAEPVLVPLAVRVALAVPLADALVDGGGTHAHDSVNVPPPVPALNGATSTSSGLP